MTAHELYCRRVTLGSTPEWNHLHGSIGYSMLFLVQAILHCSALDAIWFLIKIQEELNQKQPQTEYFRFFSIFTSLFRLFELLELPRTIFFSQHVQISRFAFIGLILLPIIYCMCRYASIICHLSRITCYTYNLQNPVSFSLCFIPFYTRLQKLFYCFLPATRTF